MKIVKKIGIILCIFLFTTFIFGYIYQNISESTDIRTYKPVGKIYDIDNKKMHLYTGGTGDNTVVFAAGWGTVSPYVDFYPLYDKISKHSKFAVYDRFGYGYSDITNEERDIDTIVNEIHKLLIKSNQKPPYIFVGHSLASLECIRFAQKYKKEVKGIVLVDGGNPDLYAEAKPMTFIGIFQRQLIKFGIARMLFNIKGFENSLNSERNELKLLPAELKELDKTSTLLMGNNENIIDEMRKSQDNAKKVIDSGKLQNTQLTIITSGDLGEASKSWLISQKKLMEWSKYSKQFVVEDTRHYIHQYHPDIIVNEIVDIINKK